MKARRIFFVGSMMLVLLGISMVALVWRNPFSWNRVVRQTMTVLQSEALNFLVTDKITTQILVETNENSPLLGRREGVLVATITLYYGMNLNALSEEAIVYENNRMVIMLPQLEELDFAVDLDSLRAITRRSGLNVIADYVLNKDLEAELRSRVKSVAYDFLTQKEMIPTRTAILNRMQGTATLLSAKTGIPVEFR